MLGYGLIIACGLAMAIEAVVGYVLAVQSENWTRRQLFKMLFLVFAALGLAAMVWGDWRIWHSYQEGTLADVEMSGSDADVQLQRIGSILGANPHQPSTALGDDIVRRLPTRVWHMLQAQQDAFGQALDQVPAAERFKIVVRSIPSNDNSIAFSDDILAVLKSHGWAAESRRDFGISNSIAGLVIAVSPDTSSEDDVPSDAKRLIVMLEKAGLTPYGAPLPELRHGQFELLVGRGPK